MKSLRSTLLAWLLGAVVVIGLGGGYLIYRNALAEANAFFDYHLRATAMLLRDQAYGFARRPGCRAKCRITISSSRSGPSTGGSSTCPIRRRTCRRASRSGSRPTTSGDGRFRTFSVVAREYLIQVAQPMAERERRAARLAFRTLLPFGLLMPVLALLIGWIVNRTLAPLNELALRLRRREPMATEPLAVRASPTKCAAGRRAQRPAARLRHALEHERAFIADAAHELRTPLTALRLQVRCARHGRRIAERQPALARLRRHGARDATRRAAARAGATRAPRHTGTERVELGSVAREVVEELLPLADRKHIDLGVEGRSGRRR